MANYIISLAHFCELHGPSTIICTQVTDPKYQQQHFVPSTSKLQTCASCKLMLPNDEVNIVTNDDSNVYISTNYPSLQKRYLSLTKLVMKSLFVETTSDITKPMFSGDIMNGYCISIIFKVKDINARGSERKYSLLVVSDSESELLENWDIISMYFHEVILLIQLQVSVSSEGSPKKEHGTYAMLDNERFLRRSMIKPKSLVDLTNDINIFVKFHLWGIELLKDILR